jgi:hypothetical protein
VAASQQAQRAACFDVLELRLNLAQHLVYAQRAELQQHIGQLLNAGTERETKAA